MIIQCDNGHPRTIDLRIAVLILSPSALAVPHLLERKQLGASVLIPRHTLSVIARRRKHRRLAMKPHHIHRENVIERAIARVAAADVMPMAFVRKVLTREAAVQMFDDDPT